MASSAASTFRLASESETTYRLKWAAWEWLYSVAGCRCLGLEVRLQGPWGSVVDVVGVGPGNIIYAVEVKISRSDFARDNHTEADLSRLRRRAAALSRRIRLVQTAGYRDLTADHDRLTRERQQLRARLKLISTKFHNPRFLAIADYHYIMAPTGVVLPEKLPPGWGLLAPAPEEIVPAPPKTIRKTTGIMTNVLRAVARANSATMMRAHGVSWSQQGARFPALACPVD